MKFQSKFSVFDTRKWIWKSPKWRSFSLDPNVLINTHFQLYTRGYQLNRKSKLKTFDVNWILESKFQWNIDKDETTLIQENAFENVNKMAAILSRPHLVNCVLIKHNQVSQLYSPPKTELIHKISWNLTDVWLITSNCSNSNTTNLVKITYENESQELLHRGVFYLWLYSPVLDRYRSESGTSRHIHKLISAKLRQKHRPHLTACHQRLINKAYGNNAVLCRILCQCYCTYITRCLFNG